MANTRQQIVAAIETRLKAIDGTGGYHTDFNSNVKQWRIAPLGNSELPCVVVRDFADEVIQESIGGGNSLIDHDLSVDISLPLSGTVPENFRNEIADIYKAIGTDETWGGLAHFTQQLGDEVVMHQEENKYVSVDIHIKIRYRTTKWAEN